MELDRFIEFGKKPVTVAAVAAAFAGCGTATPSNKPDTAPTITPAITVPGTMRSLDVSPSPTTVVIPSKSPDRTPTPPPTAEVTPNPDAITPDKLIAQIQSGEALKLYPNTTKADLIKLGDSLIDSSNGSLGSLLFFKSKDTLHTRIGLCTDAKLPQEIDSNWANLTVFALIAQGKLPNSQQAEAFFEGVAGHSAHALQGKDDQDEFILTFRNTLSSLNGN